MAGENDKMLEVDFGTETELPLDLTQPEPTLRRDGTRTTRDSAASSLVESLVIPPRQSYRPTPPLKDSNRGRDRRQRKSEEDRESSEMIRIGLTASLVEAITSPPPAVPISERQSSEKSAPERPSRPSSLRLSGLTRQGTLTSNKVITLGRIGHQQQRSLSRPGTASTQHTAVTMTSSSTRYSWQNNGEGKVERCIKYGQGKHGTIELVPQPSDDIQDPLNWPTWKKELHFYSLLMTVAIVGVMKTIFVSVNNVIANDYAVSYTAVTALTGVPLILSAFSGLGSLTAAKLFGRRPVYLVSMLLLFLGSMINTNATTNYAQCMVARFFQGLGWGAFDTLILGSIYDTYFEHERQSKLATYRIVSIATTWGPPLIGGVASQGSAGFGLQFDVLLAFQTISILLLVFGAPETMFDRATSLLQTPVTGTSYADLPWSRATITKARIIEYVKDVVRPYSFAGPSVNLGILLQAPTAMIAPTTIFVFLASFLPFVTLWGFSSSLSLLFAVPPFQLLPATVGSLMVSPFILATATIAASFLISQWHHSFGIRTSNLYALGAGSILSFIGILGFGLYAASTVATLRFSAISFLLGLLATGAYVLDATATPLINRSTTFTSSSLAVAMRSNADMDGGLAVLRALFAGIFVMALPTAVATANGLRSTSIGIAVVELLVAGITGAAWWMWDGNFRRMDGRIMGCVDLDFLKESGSFFDTTD